MKVVQSTLLRACRLLLGVAAFAVSLAGPARAQSTEHRGIRAAIAAYEAGELTDALRLLDQLPPSLPAADQAVRLAYRGLVQYALGAPDSAAVSFSRAVRADPGLQLDPAVHAPNRVAAFAAARRDVVDQWRTEARRAETQGDTVTALRRWEDVRSAEPDDPVAPERIAALRRVARAPVTAVADSTPAEAAGPVRVLDPGRAAILGLVVPGLGEIYTGKTGIGALIMGTAVVGVGVGIAVKKITIDCLSPPVDGACPPDSVAEERAERPYLVPGVGIAVVATLLGAVDAALRADRTRTAASAAPGEPARLEGPALSLRSSRLQLDLLRIRF